MQISEIMNLIDENKLNEVGKLYKIDKVNNKITGKFIIKSFVHCILKKYIFSLLGFSASNFCRKLII